MCSRVLILVSGIRIIGVFSIVLDDVICILSVVVVFILMVGEVVDVIMEIIFVECSYIF